MKQSFIVWDKKVRCLEPLNGEFHTLCPQNVIFSIPGNNHQEGKNESTQALSRKLTCFP
jgi:hypothetical protein